MLRFQEGSFRFLELVFTPTVVSLCSVRKALLCVYVHFLQVDIANGHENYVHILNFSCILENNNEKLIVIVI